MHTLGLSNKKIVISNKMLDYLPELDKHHHITKKEAEIIASNLRENIFLISDSQHWEGMTFKEAAVALNQMCYEIINHAFDKDCLMSIVIALYGDKYVCDMDCEVNPLF